MHENENLIIMDWIIWIQNILVFLNPNPDMIGNETKMWLHWNTYHFLINKFKAYRILTRFLHWFVEWNRYWVKYSAKSKGSSLWKLQQSKNHLILILQIKEIESNIQKKEEIKCPYTQLHEFQELSINDALFIFVWF